MKTKDNKVIIKIMNLQLKAYIYAILAVLFWSTVATAFKITLKYMNFLNLLLYSSFFSTIILFIIVLLQKKLPYLKKLSNKEWIFLGLLGGLNPFTYYLILFKAYSILPAQEAQSLNYTWPIVLVILSAPLLKQKITIKNIIALIIGFIGVIIIGTHGRLNVFSFSDPFGVMLAIGSSFIWALFWIYNVKNKKDEVIKLFINFLSGFFFTLITVLLIYHNIYIPSSKGIIGTIYIGIFEMSITFILWLLALSLSETSAKIGNLVFFSPFLSLLFIHFIIGEKILASTVAGLFFIIGSIFINNRKKSNF